MIDRDAVEGFDWDAGNALKSEAKHGVTQSEAEQVFLAERVLIIADERHSASASRYHALGQTEDARWLHISFTMRGNRVRVISARDMNRKERTLYEDQA
ncbi:MAG TPA: BrnT family toxin [Stellaceae bacterium]|nr:BrnT family toxin [Stellaceae bacterium]